MTEVSKTAPKVTATADVVKAGEGPKTTPENTKGTGTPPQTLDLDKEASKPIPADAGKGAEVSAEEQKIIDAAMGDHSEGPDDDEDDPKPASTQKISRDRAEQALRNFRKVAKGIPANTPDDHPLWGNPHGNIRVGDLRALLSVLPELD